jgi:hypothetical protein
MQRGKDSRESWGGGHDVLFYIIQIQALNGATPNLLQHSRLIIEDVLLFGGFVILNQTTMLIIIH